MVISVSQATVSAYVSIRSLDLGLPEGWCCCVYNVSELSFAAWKMMSQCQFAMHQHRNQ